MNERDIFIEALDRTSPDERRSWLDQACGNDPDLRSRVELLLRAHDDAGSMLDHPVLGDRSAKTICRPTDREPGQPPEADVDPNEIALDFLEPSGEAGHIGLLGQFQVREVIGQGGMGVVLRANDPKLNRTVAIKVLASQFTANATARKRFLREARAAAAVTHPHVIAIYAVDERNTPPYLVMECVDGQSLQQKIDREGELELKEILRIGSQIASGLAAAHAHGLIHRDIKPANILLENGVERVKITDFGLARAIDDLSITRSGEVTGTPQYMSPEQASGEGVDNRTDLFSLGCVLYAMCTGRSAFRANSTMAVLRRVCDDVHRPIDEINPEIPDALVAIIDRLLAKNPDERFQTAQEVADLLEQHLASLQYPGKAPPPEAMGTPADSVVQPRPGAHDAGVDEAFVSRRNQLRCWPWGAAAIILLALVGSLGITEASGVTHLAAAVIRIAAGEGTLVIEVDDPTVKVSIDGEDVSIRGAGVESLRLRTGEYQLRATKDGKPIKTELVTISRGGREVVRVTMDPKRVVDEREPVAGARVEWKVEDGGNGHRYMAVAVPEGITWMEANERAVAAGGHLVTITSEEENVFVNGLVDQWCYWNRPQGWKVTTLGPWIGGLQVPGSREPNEGWAWVTGEPFDFANWGSPRGYPHNPDDICCDDERCNRRADRIRLYTKAPRPHSPLWADANGSCKRSTSYVVEFDEFGVCGHVEAPTSARDSVVEWEVADGGNGHSYQAVCVPGGITWHEANRQAMAAGGHLVTITSKAENDFVFQLVNKHIYWDRVPGWTTSTLGPWIGGVQAKGGREPDGGWQWVTGEPFDFASWSPRPHKEPNDGHYRIGDGADRLCLIAREPAMRSPTWCDARGDCRDVVSYVIEFDEFGTGNEHPPKTDLPNRWMIHEPVNLGPTVNSERPTEQAPPVSSE